MASSVTTQSGFDRPHTIWRCEINHYAGDIRFYPDANLTPGDFEALVCRTLGMCEAIGCHGCGIGDDPALSCNQLESTTAEHGAYELTVSASEGPHSGTGCPGWLVLAWWSRAGLHFEINLDESTSFVALARLWAALRGYGYLDLTFSNRTATPAEHPAACQPIFIQ